MGIRIVDFITVVASLATIAGIVAPTIRYLQRKDRDPKVIGGTIGAIVVVIIVAVLVSANFDISYHGKSTIDAPPVFGFASSTATPRATIALRPITAALPTSTPDRTGL